jgi:hypothetical protein
MIRAFFEWLEDWVMRDDNVFLGTAKLALILGVVTLTIVLPLAYMDSKDPHISLNKTDWHCTHEHQQLVPISAGKSVILVPESVCDQWTENGY